MDEEDPEIAVELDSFLDPSLARITVLVERPVGEEIEEWWRSWWDEADGPCEAEGLILQPISIRQASQVSLTEYRKMTTLPLARISPD
jgi:hypothetical protein